jgi:hypothetical protein
MQKYTVPYVKTSLFGTKTELLFFNKNPGIVTGSKWDIHIHGFYIIWRVGKNRLFRLEIHALVPAKNNNPLPYMSRPEGVGGLALG